MGDDTPVLRVRLDEPPPVEDVPPRKRWSRRRRGAVAAIVAAAAGLTAGWHQLGRHEDTAAARTVASVLADATATELARRDLTQDVDARATLNDQSTATRTLRGAAVREAALDATFLRRLRHTHARDRALRDLVAAVETAVADDRATLLASRGGDDNVYRVEERQDDAVTTAVLRRWRLSVGHGTAAAFPELAAFDERLHHMADGPTGLRILLTTASGDGADVLDVDASSLTPYRPAGQTPNLVALTRPAATFEAFGNGPLLAVTHDGTRRVAAGPVGVLYAGTRPDTVWYADARHVAPPTVDGVTGDVITPSSADLTELDATGRIVRHAHLASLGQTFGMLTVAGNRALDTVTGRTLAHLPFRSPLGDEVLAVGRGWVCYGPLNGGGVHVYDVARHRERTVTDDQSSGAAASPDGRLLLVEGTEGGVRLVDPLGDTNRVLTVPGDGSVGNDGPPVWTPDGTTFAVPATNGTSLGGPTAVAYARVTDASLHWLRAQLTGLMVATLPS